MYKCSLICCCRSRRDNGCCKRVLISVILCYVILCYKSDLSVILCYKSEVACKVKEAFFKVYFKFKFRQGGEDEVNWLVLLCASERR